MARVLAHLNGYLDDYAFLSRGLLDLYEAGFDRAREFIEFLVEKLGLSTQRTILVPGNHDVQDASEAWRYFPSEAEAASLARLRAGPG